MGKYLWLKETQLTQGRIKKMLFTECHQPTDTDFETGGTLHTGAPFIPASLRKLTIDGIEHTFYFRERLRGGSWIFIKVGGVWYRGQGYLFTNAIYTSKKKMEMGGEN